MLWVGCADFLYWVRTSIPSCCAGCLPMIHSYPPFRDITLADKEIILPSPPPPPPPWDSAQVRTGFEQGWRDWSPCSRLNNSAVICAPEPQKIRWPRPDLLSPFSYLHSLPGFFWEHTQVKSTGSMSQSPLLGNSDWDKCCFLSCHRFNNLYNVGKLFHDDEKTKSNYSLCKSFLICQITALGLVGNHCKRQFQPTEQ